MIFAKLLGKWHKIPVALKVSVAYAVCGILQRSLSFITLPLFTRILTTEEYGQATLYGSWGGIFAIIITLQLPYGSFGPAMMKFEDRRDGYLSALEGIFLCLAFVFLAVYLPFRSFWNRFFQIPTFFVLLLVAEQVAQGSNSLWQGKKRYEFRYKSVVALTLSVSVLSPLVAYFFVMNSEQKGWARIFGGSVVTILTGGGILLLNVIRGKKLFNREFWKYALGFNVPLVPYYLSQMIFNQSDRIMISHYTGASDAGLYGVAYNLAMILIFVVASINSSYVPWFYGRLKVGRQAENKPVAGMIAVFMAVLILFVIWFAPEVILIMAGEKYASAVYVVPPVAMSLLLSLYTGFFTNVEFYYEEKWKLISASIGSAILNIGLNAWLIPVYGYVAAGYTTFASFIVFALANYAAMKVLLKRRGITESGYSMKWLTIIFLIFATLGFTGLALYRFRMIRICIASCGAVAALTRVRQAKELMARLKRG